MEIWEFLQQNTISIVSVIVAAVGSYFGARSYFIAEEEKEREEIAKIKQLLVGSSEVSVQNLTDVIETLRSRVDRLEEDRERIQGLFHEERDRASRIEKERDRMEKEVEEAHSTIEDMKRQIRRLKSELSSAEDEIDELREE